MIEIRYGEGYTKLRLSAEAQAVNDMTFPLDIIEIRDGDRIWYDMHGTVEARDLCAADVERILLDIDTYAIK